MKKTEEKARWAQAHINGKDIVAEFIIENLETEIGSTSIHARESCCGEKYAMYVDTDLREFLVEIVFVRNTVQVISEYLPALERVTSAICTPINNDVSTDLYATIEEGRLNTGVNHSQAIKFYYTDNASL